MAEDNKETQLFGRRVLYANYDESDLSEDVIQQILNRVFPIHMRNVSEIEYLENYYRGMQPILKKVKIVRPEINNVVLEIFCYKDYKNLPETAKSTATDLPIVGVKHLALGVTDIEIGKKFVIKNELCSNIEIKVGRLGKPYFFITDPDGIQIEIIEE